MPDLQTIDIEGVDLLAAGGPYHGSGSPKGGDHYTVEDLRRIAEETNRLMQSGELRAPVKLGHSHEQRLLRESGFTDGEMPAAGWLDNIRVEGTKLKGDLRRVPRTLGDLINVGAFRTRSVELRSIQSQRDGSRSGPVVSALAWLGAKAPAVRTLDDVVLLYNDQPIEEDGVTTVTYSDDTWNPEWGYRSIQSSIQQALVAQDEGEALRVLDIGPDRALAAIGDVTWVVPFEVTPEGNVEIAERRDWSLGHPDWAKHALGVVQMCEGAADSQGEMNEIAFTHEQTLLFAEHLGLDAETLTADEALAALENRKVRALSEDEVVVKRAEYEEVVANAAAGASAAQRLYETERNALLTKAVEDGRINPGDLDRWTSRYDESPETISEILSMLPGRDFSERGVEGHEPDDLEKAYTDQWLAYQGATEVN